MDIVDRLMAFRDYVGLSNSQLADKAGIPRPTLSQFLNGRNKRMSDDLTTKLHAAFPELNVLWLLFGEGDMLIAENIKTSEAKKEPIQDNFPPQAIENKPGRPTEAPTLFSTDPEPKENLAGNVAAEFEDPAAYGRPEAQNVFATQAQAFTPPSNLPTDPAKKVQSIMVFYSDQSYEIFTPKQN